MGRRFALLIGAAALGAALIAGGASADFRRVNDPRGDTRCGHEHGQHGACSDSSRRNADIVRATAGHGKNGWLKHTIRVVGKVQHVSVEIQTRPTPACAPATVEAGFYQVEIRRGRPGKVRPCYGNKSTGRARYDFHHHSVEIWFSERSIGTPQSYRWSAFATDGGCPYNDCVGSAPRRTSPHADDRAPNRHFHLDFRRDYIQHRLGDSGVAATGVMALGAQTAAAVVKYDTELTIGGEGSPARTLIHGSVLSDSDHNPGYEWTNAVRKCMEGRRVVLFKRRPGADRRLGSDRSHVSRHDAHGYWEVRIHRDIGFRVWAKVKPKVRDRFVCRADRVTIRH
jgi:hypothetical protein